jgi:hypothetical protein
LTLTPFVDRITSNIIIRSHNLFFRSYAELIMGFILRFLSPLFMDPSRGKADLISAGAFWYLNEIRFFTVLSRLNGRAYGLFHDGLN